MTEPMEKGADVVLGFCRLEIPPKTRLRRFMLYDNLIHGLKYLSLAILGKPFMGLGRNLAYKKQIFFDNKGFSSVLSIDGGEDDLFLNRTMRKRKVSVAVSPQSMTATDIVENFSDSLTLDSLAEIAGLSATYFSKKFKATTGFGVKEYISFVRLRHAAMELLSTRRSITEIVMGCGFSDSGYFKDAFKKLNGLSPREFRKAHNLSIQDETL